MVLATILPARLLYERGSVAVRFALRGQLFTATYTQLSATPTDICIRQLFYVSFGQAIAAFSPNELLASLFVPLFFLFVVSFCGVVVPYASLPYFWRSWVWAHK